MKQEISLSSKDRAILRDMVRELRMLNEGIIRLEQTIKDSGFAVLPTDGDKTLNLEEETPAKPKNPLYEGMEVSQIGAAH